MSSWFNISEDIWVVWRLCRLCRQRLAILGCWVFAFLAWFPIPGTRTSAPEGRRWLPTELVFQNIPQPDTVVPWEAADPLSTATTQKTVEERILRGGARRTCCEHFSGLKGMPWSRLHFFFLAGTERFPFFFELSQDWKSESLLCAYPRSLGRATVFHFTCALCLAQGWPWETPKCLHHQRQQNVF